MFLDIFKTNGFSTNNTCVMGNQFLYVLVVGTKRKPSVPGEKVTAQKSTTTTTEFVDGRRLKKRAPFVRELQRSQETNTPALNCWFMVLIVLVHAQSHLYHTAWILNIANWKKTSPIFGCMLSFRTFSLLLWAWEVNTSLSSRLQASTTLVTLFWERRCLFYFLPWYENLKGA